MGPLLSAPHATQVPPDWSTTRVLTSTWSLDPSVLVGCAALLVAYLLAAGRLTARYVAFAWGVLILCLALISPIDTLGDRYLFSVHMAQHLLLMLLVPPLLLVGLEPEDVRALLHVPALDRAERLLSYPPLSWSLAVATLWIWHAPALYDLAVQYEGVHIVQHLTFLVTSTIFWWPIVVALPERRRLPHLTGVIYLLGASFSSAILGVIITFAPCGLYPAYLHPVDPAGLLPLIRNGWGLSPTTDQQLGGALMWVLGGLTYLLATVAVLARWYGEPEEDELPDLALGAVQSRP